MELVLFVDYDNVDVAHTRAGPVQLARMLASLVPSSVMVNYRSVLVRLYGGWRSKKNLTNRAQRLVPDIHANSPAIHSFQHDSEVNSIRFNVELASGPMGVASIFEETLVQDRDLRSFRARAQPWNCCGRTSACGFQNLVNSSSVAPCPEPSCSARLGDLFVREEQKMVDTLLVADLAHCVYRLNRRDIVLISSDIDMWPGVILALQAGCKVVHIHTQQGWSTQRHLLRTLPAHFLTGYFQKSV